MKNQKRMKLKLVVGIFVMAVLGTVATTIICSKASNSKQVYNDDTVITEDNILDVLDMLQVEHGEIQKTDESLKEGKITVKQLKEAISQVELGEITKEITLEKKEHEEIGGSIPSKKDKIENKKLTQSEKHDSYVLDYSVNVKINKTKKKYIETTGQNVELDSDISLITYKLGKKSLSSSCTDKKVTLKADIKVKVYIGIGNIGLIEISSQKIKSTLYWNM